MKHILPAALLFVSIAGCTCAKDAAPTEAWTPLPATAWHWNNHPFDAGMPKVWTVEADGTLHHAAGNGSWGKADLISNDGTFRDFELELEWKLGKAANSGVFYRIQDNQPMPWQSGFEHQILDDDGFNGGKAGAVHRAGAFYSIIAANDQKKVKPVGEWNTSRIVAQGNHIEHWLNGKCIVKLDLDSPEFKAAYAKSEWKGNPAKGAAPNGFIGLQDHGGEVWYRNIKVRKLEN
jgi:hypothetical protein